MWLWETLFFFCVKQKHKYIKSSTSKHQFYVPPLLISQKWLNFHYRPRFVFHYWPQNVCFLCVLPDLQTATSDNIFSWIMPKHQYKASECLSLPLKTPCLQTPQDWLFAYQWTKYEIVVFPTLSQSECVCCLPQLKYCLSRMWEQIRTSFSKHFQPPKSQNSQSVAKVNCRATLQ